MTPRYVTLSEADVDELREALQRAEEVENTARYLRQELQRLVELAGYGPRMEVGPREGSEAT